MKENPEAKKLILEAVDNQINSPETPYVKEHYQRLVSEGIKKKEAKRMLGCLLAVEMWEMQKYDRDFDEMEYIKKLEKLPDESYLDEG